MVGELQALLPHRPPMLLLDELVDVGEDFALSQVRIRDDFPFHANGLGVPGWILIELFAQTAALIGGYRAQREKQTPRQGYLVGTRRFRCDPAHLPCGTLLRIEARELMAHASGMCAFQCETRHESVSADCVLNIYLPPVGHESGSDQRA